MPSNTIFEKGDKQLVTELMNGAFVGELYDDYITVVSEYSPFRTQPGVTKYTFPNLTAINREGAGAPGSASGFQNCANLEEVVAPNLRNLNFGFTNCTSMRRANFPLVQIDTGATSVFSGCSSLVDVNLDSATRLPVNAFTSCASLENIELPSVVNVGTSNGSSAVFSYCTSLRRVYLPSATTIYGTANSSHLPFNYCGAIEILRFPSWTGSNELANQTANISMKLYDAGLTTTLPGNAISRFVRYTKILILRKTDAVTTLGSATSFTAGTTPTPIKVYVPSALISSYETATNWSTVLANNYVEFRALEGSRFEDPDFDDADIYNANRDALDALLY